MKNYLIFILFLFTHNLLFADSTSTKINVWAFVDCYYSYQFNSPQNHQRPFFLYSHNRTNEISINNLLLGGRIEGTKTRGAVALHTGSYVRANYAAEPEILKLIYEASAGFRITKNTWIDAGVFPSHIGSESAISADNLTLTRSMMAENTPYFESGAKISWSNGNNLNITGLLLNGWQNITENNNNKAVGTQIQYKIKPFWLLNSSTFFGKEKPGFDTVSTSRIFHNFYTQIELNKLNILASFDIGFQNQRNSKSYAVWFNPNLIVKYPVTQKFSIAARGEYYNDEKGVIVLTAFPEGFKVISGSVNCDYKVYDNLYLRLEGRGFWGQDKIFETRESFSKANYSITSSVSIKF